MTTDGLEARIADAVAGHTGGPVQVLALEPLVGGACQEMFRVDLAVSAGPRAGTRRMVLRSDAQASLPGSLGRAQEFAVIGAAVAEGVPTPAARWPSRGLVREGADAYFLDWVDGVTIGARVVRHPSLAAARERLPDQLADALARVHRVTPETAPDLPLDHAGDDPAAVSLATLRDMLDRLPDPYPGFELALRWLAEHRPAPAPVTLVHGDFRTGNFLVTPEGLAGVLDWEFARWGDPLEDVAWLCVRDWRFGELALPAGGVTTRRRFYGAYARASGREVDPARVHWWEITGNLRWGTAAVYQGLRYLEGKSADLELLAIPRRASEMAFEALRLIEVGPPRA